MNTMRLRHNKTLITGRPGVGKTTLIQKIIDRMESVNAAGFYTAEIRSKGSRQGFELKGLNGESRILAHVHINSPHRVGKYRVDRDGFEEFLVTLGLQNPDVELIVIDEIGKMELFSDGFRTLVHQILNSDKPLLASIALKGSGFIKRIKQRSDIHLVEVTRENREGLTEVLTE